VYSYVLYFTTDLKAMEPDSCGLKCLQPWAQIFPPFEWFLSGICHSDEKLANIGRVLLSPKMASNSPQSSRLSIPPSYRCAPPCTPHETAWTVSP
jgi:hypothetical protein